MRPAGGIDDRIENEDIALQVCLKRTCECDVMLIHWAEWRGIDAAMPGRRKTPGKTEVLDLVFANVVGLFVAAEQAPAEALPNRLARAGGKALQSVLAHEGDRSVALDLLSADALITLALLAQAERDPDHLEAFAAGLVRAEPGDSVESIDR